MNLKTILIIAALLAISSAVFAQEKLSFSLTEAQQYALEKNLQLQNAREDVKIAGEQYKETRGQGLPQVSGTLDYMTNFNYEAELDFGGDDDQSTDMPDIDYTQFDAGDMEILKILQSMSAPSSSTIVMTDQSNAKVQLSQLIFGGQYWIGLKTAKIGEQLAKQQVNITELDVKESVTSIYQLILVTEEIVDVLEKNIKNLERIKGHTKNMFEAGLAEQTDVDQISISITQLENQKKSMKRNISLNYNMLRFQMGLENTQEIELTDSFDNLLTGLEKGMSLAGDFDVSQNPNYQIVATQEEMQKKMVDMQKWAYSPTLTGFYSYTEKLMTTGFDLSPKNAAGLNLSIPIFSGGIRKAKVDKAKIELDKVNRSKQMLEEQLKIQNNQLQYEFASAYENYNTQKENIEVAKRVLKSMEDKYRQGLVSSLDLTQANTNYLEAESNYLNAALELMQADLNLKKLYAKL